MRPPARSTRICTRTVSCSTRHMTRSRTAGRRSRITSCYARGSSRGTSITTTWPVNYPQDAVIVFNQKVREAEPGAKGKLAGILKSSMLVEVDGRFVTVSNKVLDRITVCQLREVALAERDRLHLKANRKLASG